jgi:hypothetical protein
MAQWKNSIFALFFAIMVFVVVWAVRAQSCSYKCEARDPNPCAPDYPCPCGNGFTTDCDGSHYDEGTDVSILDKDSGGDQKYLGPYTEICSTLYACELLLTEIDSDCTPSGCVHNSNPNQFPGCIRCRKTGVVVDYITMDSDKCESCDGS